MLKDEQNRKFKSRYSSLLLMAGGQVHKYTEWRIIWFNKLSNMPKGINHQKKIALKKIFNQQVKAIESLINSLFSFLAIATIDR